MRRSAFTQDPEFNTVTLRKLRATGQNTINIISDTEILKPNILTVAQLRFTNEDDKSKGFILDIDENNPKTLIIKQFVNNEIIDTGILYDTEFNKPEGVLYISPTFSLPEENELAKEYITNKPDHILMISSDVDERLFELMPLNTDGSSDYKHVRISNNGNHTIRIVYNNTILIEMLQERVSLVWCKKGFEYTWVYVP